MYTLTWNVQLTLADTQKPLTEQAGHTHTALQTHLGASCCHFLPRALTLETSSDSMNSYTLQGHSVQAAKQASGPGGDWLPTLEWSSYLQQHCFGKDILTLCPQGGVTRGPLHCERCQWWKKWCE